MAGGLVFVSILAVDKVFYVHRHPSAVQTMIPSIGRHLPFSTLCFARASTMIAFCFLSIPYRRYAGYQLVGFGTDEQKKRASTGKRKIFRQQSATGNSHILTECLCATSPIFRDKTKSQLGVLQTRVRRAWKCAQIHWLRIRCWCSTDELRRVPERPLERLKPRGFSWLIADVKPLGPWKN